MISSDYPRTMARYNRWQNGEVFAAASTLSDDQRREDRGAFWHSIHGTLSHIYWADRIWLSRFGLTDPPEVGLQDSDTFVDDFETLSAKRRAFDDQLVDWSDEYPQGPVEGTLKWFSGAAQRDVEAPLSVLLPHIFNHQTHHRGQASALITAAGTKTTDTDLFLMPDELWPE